MRNKVLLCVGMTSQNDLIHLFSDKAKLAMEVAGLCHLEIFDNDLDYYWFQLDNTPCHKLNNTFSARKNSWTCT